jgi:hypothetical protein
MKMSKGRHWHHFAVPLAWLAELDNCPSPDALADAFGDRYLCSHNPIFANVRRAALKFGYRFSAEDTPLWRDYHAFGLTTLHQILASGVIPYRDTGNTLRRLLEHNPKAALSPGFILANLKPNHAFHESAHGVACSLLRRMDQALRVLAPGERERFVLVATFAESFANTVETLGTLCRAKPISDALFYSLNSYMAPQEQRTELLDKACAETGEYLRFTLLFLASFEANLTTAGPDDHVRERIGLAAGCNADQARVLDDITKTGFNLNAGFRDTTTPMYFELLGYKREYIALTQAGWLSDPDHQQFIRTLIATLFDAAIGSPVA